jgi:hypothetical protein
MQQQKLYNYPNISSLFARHAGKLMHDPTIRQDTFSLLTCQSSDFLIAQISLYQELTK